MESACPVDCIVVKNRVIAVTALCAGMSVSIVFNVYFDIMSCWTFVVDLCVFVFSLFTVLGQTATAQQVNSM